MMISAFCSLFNCRYIGNLVICVFTNSACSGHVLIQKRNFVWIRILLQQDFKLMEHWVSLLWSYFFFLNLLFIQQLEVFFSHSICLLLLLHRLKRLSLMDISRNQTLEHWLLLFLLASANYIAKFFDWFSTFWTLPSFLVYTGSIAHWKMILSFCSYSAISWVHLIVYKIIVEFLDFSWTFLFNLGLLNKPCAMI